MRESDLPRDVLRAIYERCPEAKDDAMPTRKKSKYRAVKTTVDDIVFDSKKEAKRYGELKALVAAGKIFRLHLQPEFTLTVRDVIIGKYVADFDYWCDGQHIIEDCKGFKTPLYRWKKKHVEAQFGVTILET